MIITDNKNYGEFSSTRDFEPERNKKTAEAQNAAQGHNNVAPIRNVGQNPAMPPQRTPRMQGERRPTQQVNRPPQQTRQVRRTDRPTAAPSPAPTAVNVNGRMMQTRVSDMDKLRTSGKNEPKGKKKEKKQRGEVTNTVISIVKAVVYIVFVIVVAAFIAVEIIRIGNDVFAFVKSDEIVEVTIPENATTDDVAKILEDGGVIKYPKIFSLYAKVRKDDGVYIAGTYSVSPMQNFDSLRASFKPQEVSGTIEITIPEGYTTDEIIDLMVENGIGTREGYVNEIQNGEFDYWFVKELEEDGVSEDRIYRLDGYLFPDTYQFYLASSEWTVINKLLRRFAQIFTTEYRDQCEVLGYSVDEMITLASIIEKEAANPSEFFLVSSVFHNRLKAKWTFPNFESDATVVYAIAHETGERTVDLYYDSPYNTYQHEGFPPGPISNPSASAMLAALSPQESNYYFFLSSGRKTYFSETKAEHDKLIEQFANGEDIPAIADIGE